MVVDPRRDITEYLEYDARYGLTIEAVINTHFHADFVSGHLALVEATGAWIGFGEAAQTDYPIRRLADGEHISLDVAADKPIVVHCAGGWRSSVAASLLRAQGFDNVSDLAGGYNAWRDSHAVV